MRVSANDLPSTCMHMCSYGVSYCSTSCYKVPVPGTPGTLAVCLPKADRYIQEVSLLVE